jgi:DNA/RNA-binding domain of Phe-tRNA-synthetase-like protein
LLRNSYFCDYPLDKLLSVHYSQMKHTEISQDLKILCPHLRLGCIHAQVTVTESAPDFLLKMQEQCNQIAKTLTIEHISKIPAISASRQAYKMCGKDPARYRLSAEALLRRVVSGKGLYQISNVVDQLNLVSISTGFSIGGYDADQIQGDIIFGIGRPGEPYQAIGRGALNIENLPVFRDEIGAFGTPTSDSERTEVNNQTKHFLMILIDFEAGQQLEASIELSVGFLKDYCNADNIEVKSID